MYKENGGTDWAERVVGISLENWTHGEGTSWFWWFGGGNVASIVVVVGRVGNFRG